MVVVDGSCLMRASFKFCVGSEQAVAVVATQPELSVAGLLKSQGL